MAITRGEPQQEEGHILPLWLLLFVNTWARLFIFRSSRLFFCFLFVMMMIIIIVIRNQPTLYTQTTNITICNHNRSPPPYIEWIILLLYTKIASTTTRQKIKYRPGHTRQHVSIIFNIMRYIAYTKQQNNMRRGFCTARVVFMAPWMFIRVQLYYYITITTAKLWYMG